MHGVLVIRIDELPTAHENDLATTVTIEVGKTLPKRLEKPEYNRRLPIRGRPVASALKLDQRIGAPWLSVDRYLGIRLA